MIEIGSQIGPDNMKLHIGDMVDVERMTRSGHRPHEIAGFLNAKFSNRKDLYRITAREADIVLRRTGLPVVP